MTAGTTNFPGSLDSHTGASPLGMGEVNNQAYTKATASHTNSVTTVTVASTALFPSKGYILVKRELISYTGTTATTFTGCTRGVGGTTATAFLSGTVVEQVVTAANHNDTAAAVVAVETLMGAYGNVLALGDPIINGHFNVWQEATSFTSCADGTWTADNWIYSKVGAVVHDVLRSTDVPSVASNSPRGNYSLQLDVTTVDSSIAAGDYCTIATRIEGYNWLPFAQRQFTLSFWVKAAKTGTHCVYFRNSGTSDRTYVAEYTISAADTWEWKTITVTASPSAGTWDYTTGRGLEIGWALSCGSTFQTTAGAWQTGNYRGTSSQVNETDNTANNFRLYGVRANLGATAATGAQRPHGLEEFLCRRYSEVFGGTADTLFCTGWVGASTLEASWPMVPKRATPTVTVDTVGNLIVQWSAANTACTSLSVLGGSPDRPYIRAGVSGTPLTAGQAANLYTTGTEKVKFRSRIP